MAIIWRGVWRGAGYAQGIGAALERSLYDSSHGVPACGDEKGER
jgi:hypothetical protein